MIPKKGLHSVLSLNNVNLLFITIPHIKKGNVKTIMDPKLLLAIEKFPTILRQMERMCCNPSLGLATKARACKVAGQEGNPGVTSHTFENAKECERMNPHTPK